MNVLLMIILIGILIVVHEFGHFLAAKAFDVQVTRFGIGLPFGPTLYKKQFGETEFVIHVFLFGGYVSFPDDDETEEKEGEEKKEKLPLDSPRRLKNKNDFQKGIIFSAGVIFNYLIAFVIVLFCAICFQNLPSGDYKNITIEKILIDNPSNIKDLGAKDGDTILELNGVKVNSFYTLTNILKDSKACKIEESEGNCKDLTLKLLRDNKEIELNNVKVNSSGMLGIQVGLGEEIINETKNIKDIFKYSAQYTWNYTILTLNGIKQLFTGKIPLKDFHGIVAVTKIGGDVIAQSGMQMGLLLTAVISINLALFNLLPIPALDGGHLLFLILNRICFGKINERVYEKVTVIFFMLLLGLIIAITLNDIYALIIHKF